jgi:pyruvate/2-oxoglutarate/acetoin dehydrogenase E1 component
VPKLDDFVLPIGKAQDRARQATTVTIVSWSMGMTYALKAAEELAKEGIDAEVIDLRTLSRWTPNHSRIRAERRHAWSLWRKAGSNAASAPKLPRA